MIKTIFFNLIFIFSLTAIGFAAEEGSTDDLGKEKPKNYSTHRNVSKHSQSFSLRSDMYFKGGNLINAESTDISKSYSSLNILNFKKENAEYLLPYKKKAILNKLTFNPNEVLRNYSGR